MGADAIISIVVSLVAVTVTWGIYRERVANLREDIIELKLQIASVRDEYVSMQYFQAIIEPMQRQVSEVHDDIKTILLILSKSANFKANKKPSS